MHTIKISCQGVRYINYANVIRDKGSDLEQAGRTHSLAEPPLVYLVPYFLQKRWYVHPPPLYFWNHEFKWALVLILLIKLNESRCSISLHVFNWLACIFFTPSTYMCCLWSNIIRKTCSSKWLIDKIWYDAINLTLSDKVLGMFYLKKKPYKLLSDDIFPPKPYVVYIRKPHTFAACYYIELCQIVVTLARSFSCFHDQDHVHSIFIC
jgi:hypothetical protein